MPNMFGGPQDHPAYDPRTEIGENQVLLGNTLYTKDGKTVTALDVDGSERRYAATDPSLPQAVRDLP